MAELNLSKEIASSAEEADTHIPANGKKFEVQLFRGEAAYSQNAAVKLVWDYGGGGETIIWVIKGSGDMPFVYTNTGDGTKKIAISLDNGESGALYLSGYADIWEED